MDQDDDSSDIKAHEIKKYTEEEIDDLEDYEKDELAKLTKSIEKKSMRTSANLSRQQKKKFWMTLNRRYYHRNDKDL